MKEKIFYAVVIALYIGIVFTIGAYFSVPVSPFFDALILPSFTPRPRVFIFAWIVICVCTGIAAYISWIKKQGGLLYVYALNGALNALWTYVFFDKGNIGFAFVIVLLLMATVYYIFKKSNDNIVKILLVPYMLWLFVAAILNYSIFVLN